MNYNERAGSDVLAGHIPSSTEFNLVDHVINFFFLKDKCQSMRRSTRMVSFEGGK